MNHPSTVAVSIDLSGWLRALDCCPGDLTLLGSPGRLLFPRSCSQHSLQHSLCCRSAAYEKIPAMRIETRCSWIGYKTIHRRFRGVLNSFENLRYRSESPPMPRPVFRVPRFRAISAVPVVAFLYPPLPFLCPSYSPNDCYLILVPETMARYRAVCFGDTHEHLMPCINIYGIVPSR